MATRRINGTLDTFSVDTGSEITYVGGSTTGDKSDDVRGFEVNPGGTGIPKIFISARFAPLPPSKFFISALPSALPSPNRYTYFTILNPLYLVN